MSLRARLTIAAAAAVAVSVAGACLGAYLIARSDLRGEVDRSLRDRAAHAEGHRGPGLGLGPLLPPPPFGGAGGLGQLVGADGRIVALPGAVQLPTSQQVLEVAAGSRGAFFADARVEGVHLRVLTAPLRAGLAIEVARPLDEVDRTLHRLGLVLLLVGIGGVALAALLGAGVARTALGPVRRLRDAAAHVARTRDLSRRVEGGGGGELAALAGSFNTMLAALEDSLGAQQRLVADASHELRTPLTSLRTNIEVMTREGNGLPEDDRRRLLHDVVVQLEELTLLVADVAELARDGEAQPAREPVRLDEVVQAAVERARRNSASVRFELELEREPSVVEGDAARIDRAAANLLDNAAKWSPPEGVVEVSVRGRELVVRDHGPGIDEADLPHVFDRFYRAPAARGLPGSGLGLAIVRRVAEQHGATATAERAEGGGSRFRLTFPERAPTLSRR